MFNGYKMVGRSRVSLIMCICSSWKHACLESQPSRQVWLHLKDFLSPEKRVAPSELEEVSEASGEDSE